MSINSLVCHAALIFRLRHVREPATLAPYRGNSIRTAAVAGEEQMPPEPELVAEAARAPRLLTERGSRFKAGERGDAVDALFATAAEEMSG